MFIHMIPQPLPSRQAKELAGRVVEVVQEYRRAHPDLRNTEVHQALRLAAREVGGHRHAILATVIAVTLVLVMGLAALKMVKLRSDRALDHLKGESSHGEGDAEAAEDK